MTTTLARRRFLQSGLAASCALAGLPARAADGRVLFGFQPVESTNRAIAAVLQAIQGHYQPGLGSKPVYMTGNAGALAMEATLKGASDGSTALLLPSIAVTLQPLLRALPNIDPVRDFVPVAPFSEFTLAFLVGPSVPLGVRTMKDYLRWVTDNPMSANFGIHGLGTASHLVGMAVARTANVPLKPVPYKSLISQMEDLINGSLPASITVLESASDNSHGGRLRALAVASDARWPGQPQVPTLLELGLCEFSVVESLGLFMAAGTPPEKVQELRAATQWAAKTPAVTAALTEACMRSAGNGGTDYAGSLAKERSAWMEIMTKQRFTLEG